MGESKILLVEGRAEVASERQSALVRAGYRVLRTTEQDEALKLMASFTPRLLILGALESSDSVALGAAAEMAGVVTLYAATIKEPERMLERVASLLERSELAPASTPPNVSNHVDKLLLDDLAVALADEISDREELMDLGNKAPEPKKALVSPKEHSSVSDGVTQILGLIEMSAESDSGSPRIVKPLDPSKQSEAKSAPQSSPAENSPELAASLFALAVGKDGPLVTRVAKPHAEASPKEEEPIESAIFTPPGVVKELPPEPPKIDRSQKTKNLSAGQKTPQEPPRKKPEEPPPALAKPKEETRRVSLQNQSKEPTPQSASPKKEPDKDPLEELFAPKEKAKKEPTPNSRALSQERPALVPNPATFSVGLPLSPLPGSEEPLILRSARVIHELFVSRAHGVVTSRSQSYLRTISLRDGSLVQATSNAPDDQLAWILYREGKLTRAQLEEIKALGERPQDELIRTIYKRGFARRTELEAALKKQREEIVTSVLEGKLEFEAKEILAPITTERPLSALLLNALRRRLGAPEAKELLRDATLSPASCPACAPRSLGLSSQELALLARVDGKSSLQEILGEVSSEMGLPLLLGLEVLGCIKVNAHTTEADDSQEELSIERARIEGKYEEAILADYFSLLGVSRRATLYEIQQAHKTLSEAFQVEKFRAPQFADLVGRLEEIQAVLSDALFVLSDEAMRNAYASHLAEGS